MSMLFPFSTFAFNFKNRIIGAVGKINKGNTSEGLAELRGATTEAALYAGFQAAWYKYVVAGLLTEVWSGILGMDDPDEEEETVEILGSEFDKKMVKKSVNQFVNDMNPVGISIGTDLTAWLANHLHWLSADTELEFADWEKDESWFDGNISDTKFGTYSMGAEMIEHSLESYYNLYQSEANDRIYIYNQYLPFSPKEVKATDKGIDDETLHSVAFWETLLNSSQLIIPTEVRSSFKLAKEQWLSKDKKKNKKKRN
jgi:hypothetical protein